MKHKIIITSAVFLLAIIFNSIAQERLIIPKETRKAFDNKTRQSDGNPGENYWQNTFVRKRESDSGVNMQGHE